MKKSNYNDIIAHQDFDRFLLLAQKKFETLYQTNKLDTNNIKNLADIYRKKGLLNKAREKYIELVKYGGTKYDNYLKTIFCQEAIEDINSGMKAAPFVIISNFLSSAKQSVIWDTIEIFSSKFRDSKVATKIDKEIRESKVLYRKNIEHIADFFLPKITDSIHQKISQLGVSPFKVSKTEIQLTLHTDGHFFTVHKDAGKRTINRRVTYVYYFHQIPKAYSGGDLLLFDTNQKEDRCSTNYTRIITQNNMLLLFPSFYYHQVTPVNLKEQDFRKGRFTINGWLHEESTSS